MAERIVGIITLGLCCIGLLVWLGWLINRGDEQKRQEWSRRYQDRGQSNDFIIRLFNATNNDLEEQLEAKDKQIADLQKQLNKLRDTASKIKIKDIKHQEVEQ